MEREILDPPELAAVRKAIALFMPRAMRGGDGQPLPQAGRGLRAELARAIGRPDSDALHLHFDEPGVRADAWAWVNRELETGEPARGMLQLKSALRRIMRHYGEIE